jgi:hypothetical protein
MNGLPSTLTRSLKVTFFGALLVSFAALTYPLVATLGLVRGLGKEGFVEGYAYLALGLTAFGLCILFYGATGILVKWSTSETLKNPRSNISITAQVFAKRLYWRLFLLSALAYGLFYGFASGIIVFQPALNFSEVYHVVIPSSAVAICCGPIGETPEVVVYVSQHLGFLLLPINLLLLFSVSWLVGLNVSFATFAIRFRANEVRLGWFSWLGALIGLFTSCPTCAGLAVIALVGGTGTLSAAFFLGPLQSLFVGLSIPILVATPIMSARSLHNLEGRACRDFSIQSARTQTVTR